MESIPGAPREETPPTEAPNDSGLRNPNVGRAGVIMVVSLLLSRVLGLVRESIISGQFGADAYLDSYRLAFSIPDLLFFMISGGALSSAFIPVFSEYWHTDKKEEAWKVFSVVTCVMSVVVLGFILVAGIFAFPLTHLTAPGKAPETYPLIVSMSRILLPAQFAFLIGGLMFGTLYARQMFSVPGLGPNIYNIGIISGAVILSGFFAVPVVGMAWGATIGALVGSFLFPFLTLRKIGCDFKISFDTRHPGVRKVFKLMLPVVLGLSLPGVFALIMQAFASYYPDGTNSILDYANKLMQAPLGIFGQSLAIAVFPALSQFFAQGRMDRFCTQLNSTLRQVVYLTIPVSVLMAVMAPQLVAAMYEHGKFTPDQTLKTALCLQLFAVGIWAWCLHPILMRAFYSIQDTVTPVILGTATTGVFILLLLVLRQTSLSYRALPLASSISAILLVLMMLTVLHRKIGGIEITALLKTTSKSLVGSIGVAIVSAAIAFSPISQYIWGKKFLTLGVTAAGLGIAMIVYYLITQRLQMAESEYIQRAINRVKGKLSRTANSG